MWKDILPTTVPHPPHRSSPTTVSVGYTVSDVRTHARMCPVITSHHQCSAAVYVLFVCVEFQVRRPIVISVRRYFCLQIDILSNDDLYLATSRFLKHHLIEWLKTDHISERHHYVFLLWKSIQNSLNFYVFWSNECHSKRTNLYNVLVWIKNNILQI